MARRPINEYWRQRVCVLTENEPGLSAPAMARRLEREAEQQERDDYPSERWVRREQAEYRSRQPAERTPYRQVSWPESMGTPELPWEASAAALELLRDHHKRGFPRPMISLVKWFWRVSVAAPGTPFADCYEIAAVLQGAEIANRPLGWRRAEARIALGEMPGAWFGEELGENLAVSVGEDRLADVLSAVHPVLGRKGAESIARFIRGDKSGYTEVTKGGPMS